MTYFDLNIDLSSDDRALRDEAHKFAKEVIRPVASELDYTARMRWYPTILPFGPI